MVLKSQNNLGDRAISKKAKRNSVGKGKIEKRDTQGKIFQKKEIG
jgi:hypothetical protein